MDPAAVNEIGSENWDEGKMLKEALAEPIEQSMQAKEDGKEATEEIVPTERDDTT